MIIGKKRVDQRRHSRPTATNIDREEVERQKNEYWDYRVNIFIGESHRKSVVPLVENNRDDSLPRGHKHWIKPINSLVTRTAMIIDSHQSRQEP